MSSPTTTSQFVTTLGVNVHVEYTDGKYANATNVVNDLAYLGISHVRDAVLNPGNQGQSNYDVLASAGVKFDMFFQGNNLVSTLQLLDAFLARHPGAVSLIEGPNEVNNFPISYGGQTGDAAAVAYQNALFAAVKGDASLRGVPVADLTSYPFLKGSSDYANYHFYPFHGSGAQAAYGTSLSDLATEEPGKPMVMTEGGYNTLLADTYFGGVDELTQAKLTLNLYCDNAKAGVATSYIYQLLDAYADPTNSNSDSHFGLFHLDNSPKLAATAIHNLVATLSTGADANVANSALGFQVQGLASPNDILTLTKNGSVHDILLWNEPIIWNFATTSAVAAAPTVTTLHFDQAANVSVFDPLTGTSAIASYVGVHDVAVNVVDHPLIVEVTTLAQSTPTVAPPPAPVTTPPVTSTGTPAAPIVTPAQTPSSTAPGLASTSTSTPSVTTPSTSGSATVTPPSTVPSTVPTTHTTAATEASAFSSSSALALSVQNLTRMPVVQADDTSNPASSGAHIQAATSISAQLTAGAISAQDAHDALLHLVDGTTSVAVTSYAFFTGKTPTAQGLDYLVHSSANPNDLNDPYYASLTTENRYINLAASLAQGGADTAAYHAAYDALSLKDATATAYKAIFANTADSAKLDALLNTSVSNGLGGQETRAQYLASFGDGDINSSATKAAVIGWLLGESIKANTGVYQQADFNFLDSLAHGSAAYNVDLLATYSQPVTLVGAPQLNLTSGT